jgi:response regulator NasT
MPKLKIVLLDDQQQRAQFIQDSLIQHDFMVIACFAFDQLNLLALEQLQADVILIDMDHPKRDILESCVSQFQVPTVLFTKNSQPDMIQNAIQAGVSAYILDGIDASKLESILTIAIAQFKKHQQLLHDLAETKNKLLDRKDIDKAKALLMQMHQLDEETAFQYLRKNAMRQRISMGDMSRRLLDAHQLLTQIPQD